MRKTYDFHKFRVFRWHVLCVVKIPISGTQQNFSFFPHISLGSESKNSRWACMNFCFLSVPNTSLSYTNFFNTSRGIKQYFGIGLQSKQRGQNYPYIKIITITMTFLSASHFICHGHKSIWCGNAKEKGVSWKKDLACTSSSCLTLFEAELQILNRSMWIWGVHNGSSCHQPCLVLSNAQLKSMEACKVLFTSDLNSDLRAAGEVAKPLK